MALPEKTLAGADGPITRAAAITPIDGPGNLLAELPRALYVGTAGNVSLFMNDDQTVLFQNMPVGWHPVRFQRVNLTGTNAGGLVAGY